MSNIKKLIELKDFKCFEELKTFFTSEPYNLIVKENKGTYMMCFSDFSDLSLIEVREATGIILDTLTNQILHYSFGKCYEGLNENSNNNLDSYSSILKKNIEVKIGKKQKNKIGNDILQNNAQSFPVFGNNYSVNLFFIGSIIKLYFFNGTWNIGTSKNLNANSSYWSSKKSFEQMFKECVENLYGDKQKFTYDQFIETLDTDFCYTYIIQHPENENIIKVAEPTLINLNQVNIKTLQEIVTEKDNFELKNKSLDSVIKNKKTANICENYLIYEFDDNGNIKNRIKILSDSYEQLKNSYGNYPDIGLRYIDLLMQETRKNFGVKLQHQTKDQTNFLRNIFTDKENIVKFNKIDILYPKACNNIVKIYNSVYVTKNKTITQIPTVYKKFIKSIYKNFVDSGSSFPVNITTINIKFMNTTNIREIGYIINYSY